MVTKQSPAVNIDYWLCCAVLAGASWFAMEYVALVKGATDSESALLFGSLVGMVLVLMTSLILLGSFVRSRHARIVSRSLIAVGAVLAFGLWLDLRLYQMMQVHVLRALRVLYGGDAITFRQSAASLGISASSIFTALGAPLVAVLAGWFVLRLTPKLSALAPLSVGRQALAVVGVAVSIAYVACATVSNMLIRPQILRVAHAAMPTALPFCSNKIGIEKLPCRIVNRPNVPAISVPSKSRPNIIVFVVECLRRDAIDPQITPNLAQLQKNCLHIGTTVSSGNATHLGWFGILTGNTPLRFRQTRQTPGSWGSEPLRAFRTLGYSTRAYSSLGLDFYKLDQIAFGRNLEFASSLLDSRQLVADRDSNFDIAKYDSIVTDTVIRNLVQLGPTNNCHFVFYNATHAPYYFAEDSNYPMREYLDHWDYSGLAGQPEKVRLVRNKYLNAVNFVDGQIGRVIGALRSSGRLENTLIAVIGDHGEEFMDEGRLFHNNAVDRAQTEIAMLIKPMSGSCDAPHPEVACSMDLLPTLLDLAGGFDLIDGKCDGHSLLRNPNGVAISVAANGDRDQNEFALNNGKVKAYFRFDSSDAPMWSRKSVWLEKIVKNDESPLQSLISQNAREFVRQTFGTAVRQFLAFE